MKRDTPSDLRFYLIRLTSLIRLASECALRRKREPRRGLLASFALAFGIALCSPATAYAPIAHKSIHINDKASAIAYAKAQLSKSQFKCLYKLYTKESNWRRNAYNKSGAYGIPQLKNPMIKDMTGSQQVYYGIKYISSRYGNPCVALAHFKKWSWH